MPKKSIPNKKPGIIYLIENLVNGKLYVGKTHATLKKRWGGHCNLAGKSDMLICRAIRKHGADNFAMDVIDKAATPKKLYEAEIFWIAALETRAPTGYNATDGGEGAVGAIKGRKLRSQIAENTRQYFEAHPEARIKLSNTAKLHFKTPRGKAQAKEHSRFMREKCKDPKHRKKLGIGIANAWKNPEFKKKMARKRREWLTPELRDRIRQSVLKYRRSKKGKEEAARTSEKLKIAQRKYYSDPIKCAIRRDKMQKYFRSKAGHEMMKRRSAIIKTPKVRHKISQSVKKRWKEGVFDHIRKSP